MPDSGPTTVGSIVARLRMDRDQWVADKAKTEADARELGALRPTIRVDMDTAAAMAQIEALRIASERAGAVPYGSVGPSVSAGAAAKVDAVAAAERRLVAAMSAADTAYARAELAQLRLKEAQDRGTGSASRLAAAELAATEAIKRLDAANERATLTEAALTQAQEKAARAALEKAAAEELEAHSTSKANEANKTSVNRMGLIVSAVALLLPLLVPVAAGAVGIAAAMTVMGVSGVAAVVGIRREMQQGTDTGKAYSDGLLNIRQNLNQLSQTSAMAMLFSFRSVTGDLNGAMPMLNRQVGAFTGLLGRSGGNLFAGSINGLRVMEPLLLTAGMYVERLTRQFDEWTQNGGLEKFADYALGVLPQVERVLGALSAAIMHILVALAPLGEVGMAVLTAVSDGINGIPVEVLGSLIGAVTWGALAFKAWGFIAPMLAAITQAAALATDSVGLLGVSMKIATGPIGWIIAGAAALAAVVAVVTTNTQNATGAIATYTSAVQADSGAIGENVRAKAAQALQDAGALDAAKRLGVSGKLVTDATLGDTAAKKKLSAQLAVINKQLRDNADASTGASGADLKRAQDLDTLTGAVSGQNKGIKDTIDAYNVYQEATGGATLATKAQRDAVEANAKAAGVSVGAYLTAMSTQGDAKTKFEQTTATMYLQNDAAGLLKQSLDLLNGKTISAASAQNQFDSQLANMSTHMDAAGKNVNRADTFLTGMTASAVKNRGELINLTSAAEANAQAFRDSGGSADDTKQKLIDMKQAIIDNAIAHGENADEVHAYVDQLFKIPDKIPATKIEVDTAAATATLNAFFHRWNGATINLNATGSAQLGSGILGHAGGGTIGGEGSGTSDSNLIFASRGEEMIRAARANVFRPMLKAINNGSPAQISAAAANLAGPSGSTVNNYFTINEATNGTAVAQSVMHHMAARGI